MVTALEKKGRDTENPATDRVSSYRAEGTYLKKRERRGREEGREEREPNSEWKNKTRRSKRRLWNTGEM